MTVRTLITRLTTIRVNWEGSVSVVGFFRLSLPNNPQNQHLQRLACSQIISYRCSRKEARGGVCVHSPSPLLYYHFAKARIR